MISYVFFIIFNAPLGEVPVESAPYETAQECKNARILAKFRHMGSSANEVYITDCYRQLNY